MPQQQGSYRNFTKGDTMERPERGRGSKSGEPADTPAETPRPGPRRLIELSHQIHHGMVTYPGLPGPELSDYLPREASSARYGPGTEFHIGRISMVANTGTYLDSLKGAQTRSCSLSVLMEEAAEQIASVYNALVILAKDGQLGRRV